MRQGVHLAKRCVPSFGDLCRTVTIQWGHDIIGTLVIRTCTASQTMNAHALLKEHLVVNAGSELEPFRSVVWVSGFTSFLASNPSLALSLLFLGCSFAANCFSNTPSCRTTYPSCVFCHVGGFCIGMGQPQRNPGRLRSLQCRCGRRRRLGCFLAMSAS